MDLLSISDRFDKKFEVVITNPPFGIRSEKSADVGFLKKALNVSHNNIRYLILIFIHYINSKLLNI